jgi:glutathionylspermidine synthase
MRRISTPHWMPTAEQAKNLLVPGAQDFWEPSAAYVFTEAEADVIEQQVRELRRIIDITVRGSIARNERERWGIPPLVWDKVRKSFQTEQVSLTRRLDCAWSRGSLKLLEANSDTPVLLPETSALQWAWLQERFPDKDQNNSLEEAVVREMQKLPRVTLYFGVAKNAPPEELANQDYKVWMARSIGRQAEIVYMEDLCVRDDQFYTSEGEHIFFLSPMYERQWMMIDQFGFQIGVSNTQFCEPTWSALLEGSKMLLVNLWEDHPGHPLLLPAYRGSDSRRSMGEWVYKPLYGYEGRNIRFITNGRVEIPSGQDYVPALDEDGAIIQKRLDIERYDGMQPILGLWDYAGELAGLGIRETAGDITGRSNTRFVPHYID